MRSTRLLSYMKDISAKKETRSASSSELISITITCEWEKIRLFVNENLDAVANVLHFNSRSKYMFSLFIHAVCSLAPEMRSQQLLDVLPANFAPTFMVP